MTDDPEQGQPWNDQKSALFLPIREPAKFSAYRSSTDEQDKLVVAVLDRFLAPDRIVAEALTDRLLTDEEMSAVYQKLTLSGPEREALASRLIKPKGAAREKPGARGVDVSGFVREYVRRLYNDGPGANKDALKYEIGAMMVAIGVAKNIDAAVKHLEREAPIIEVANEGQITK